MMDAGVDDETRSAERHRLQIAQAAEAIVGVDAQLIGELFGVKAPAFAER